MLNLNSISKTYRKNGATVQALAPINLNVDAGELVAVQGPSGSGKTTLLLIAGGLLHPDAGSVFISDMDVYALNPDSRSEFRSHWIGFVFQQYHLIPYLNVLENILAPTLAQSANKKDRALELVQQFGLEHRKDHLPGELSAGEKQRTALARALLFKPKLLLADEITGNLDAANAGIVIDALKFFAADGGAVLLVTHDADAARQTNRLITLD